MRDAESRFATSIGACAGLIVLSLVLFVLASPAKAAYIHVPGPTFQTTITTPPNSIAVDEETGSVYVMVQNGDVEKFDASGAPSNFSGLGGNVINTACGEACMQLAVDNTGGPNQGTIYLSTNGGLTFCCPDQQNVNQGGVHVFHPSGLPAGKIFTASQFVWGVRACGVAVDESGDLIVSHGEGSSEFTYTDRLDIEDWDSNPSQKAPVVETIHNDFSNPCKTAINSEGTTYMLQGLNQSSTGNVRRYPDGAYVANSNPSGDRITTPPGLPSEPVDGTPTSGIAVDDEDFLYATRTTGPPRVRKFDKQNSLIETFTSAAFFTPSAVAKNSATDTVYVTDRSSNVAAKDVHIFTAVKVPDSLTDKFTASTASSGTFTGKADPVGAGEVTACEFEYVTALDYSTTEFTGASKVPCAPAAPFNEAKDVSAPVAGLTLESPYVFRLRTENASGNSNGTVRRFTPHAVINLNTDPASSVAPRSATLNASFIGDGTSTEYFFEYSKDNLSYNNKTPVEVLPSPNGATNISAPISNLDLESLYHFRVVAKNTTGESKAQDVTFTTPPAVAGVDTNAATEISSDGVTLNGEFVGNGLDVDFYFEYGLTEAYGLVSDTGDAGETNGLTPVEMVIDEYEGYKTYHYRLVAENSFGKTFGPDMTFTSPPSPLPGVSGVSASNVTPTTAQLSADVNPNRWPTVYLFEWGPTTAYGSATQFDHILSGLLAEDIAVTKTISGLAPGTLYHYRAVALNLTGVTNGPDQTFVTPGPPTLESASVSGVGQTTAQLSALASSGGSAANVRFEYGTSPAYGSTTGASPIGSDLFAQSVAATLTGLTPGTQYHVRAVAENAVGTTNGADMTFTTQAAPIVKPPERKRPRACPKGKVKRKGKCVKKKKRKRKNRQGRGNG